MTSGWGWRRVRGRNRGGWTFLSYGSFGVAVPWITLLLLVLLLRSVAGTLTAAEGVLFDLPESGLSEGEPTKLVAMALAMPTGTLVFFDDARYVLGDGVSAVSLGDHLGERIRESGQTTLLVLADRNVPSGDLMNLTALARMSGVKRVLVANKRAEVRTE